MCLVFNSLQGIQTTNHSFVVGGTAFTILSYFFIREMQNSILCVVKENWASRARGSKSDTKINGNIFLFLFFSSSTNSDSLSANQSWCEAFDSKQEEEQWQQLVWCRLPTTSTENTRNKHIVVSISHQHHSTMRWRFRGDEFPERRRHRITLGPWQLPVQNRRYVIVRRRFGDEIFGG